MHIDKFQLRQHISSTLFRWVITDMWLLVALSYGCNRSDIFPYMQRLYKRKSTYTRRALHPQEPRHHQRGTTWSLPSGVDGPAPLGEGGAPPTQAATARLPQRKLGPKARRQSAARRWGPKQSRRCTDAVPGRCRGCGTNLSLPAEALLPPRPQRRAADCRQRCRARGPPSGPRRLCGPPARTTRSNLEDPPAAGASPLAAIIPQNAG